MKALLLTLETPSGSDIDRYHRRAQEFMAPVQHASSECASPARCDVPAIPPSGCASATDCTFYNKKRSYSIRKPVHATDVMGAARGDRRKRTAARSAQARDGAMGCERAG